MKNKCCQQIGKVPVYNSKTKEWYAECMCRLGKEFKRLDKIKVDMEKEHNEMVTILVVIFGTLGLIAATVALVFELTIF